MGHSSGYHFIISRESVDTIHSIMYVFILSLLIKLSYILSLSILVKEILSKKIIIHSTSFFF